MKDTTNQKKRFSSVVLYFYVVLILAVLLTSATYAWFNLSKTPWVSDMSVYVNTPVGLELAIDPNGEEWTKQLDLSELLHNVQSLRPVTWSQENNRFYGAGYGLDGRLSGDWKPLSDDKHGSPNNSDMYYIAATIYARCDQKTDVSLSPAVEVEEGVRGSGTFVIGKPIWNEDLLQHDNGGKGTELAIRVGFLIQKTELDGTPKAEAPVFYIYEPNCDTHQNGTEGYIETPSIDGGTNLTDSENLIKQTTNMWEEADPVQQNVVIRNAGEFVTDTKLFELQSTELAKITIYIWLEGQDVDCTNEIGHEAQLLINLQFAGDSSGQSGMVPIE